MPPLVNWLPARFPAGATSTQPGPSHRANGRGKERHATQGNTRQWAVANPSGRRDFDPVLRQGTWTLAAALSALQGEVLPYDKNIFRRGDRLEQSGTVLEDIWTEFQAHAAGNAQTVLRTREMAAMLATARWCVASALARDESRGMHQRDDRPQTSAQFNRRILVGGLEKSWIRTDHASKPELAS